MTSNLHADEAYVWVWLPGKTAPVVAGRIARQPDGRLLFNYGRSYLARDDAISIYQPELPLQPGEMRPRANMQMPSCIRDSSPDAWGRRVIINRTMGLKGRDADSIDLDEITYLMESGSDRIGALDFQLSATEYNARERYNATLDELIRSAERVERVSPFRYDAFLRASLVMKGLSMFLDGRLISLFPLTVRASCEKSSVTLCEASTSTII